MTWEIRRGSNQLGMRVLETGAATTRVRAKSVLAREAVRSTGGARAIGGQ
jgi:hypothetical protein